MCSNLVFSEIFEIFHLAQNTLNILDPRIKQETFSFYINFKLTKLVLTI